MKSLIPEVRRMRTTVAYVGMVIAAVAIFFWIRAHGVHLTAPPSSESDAGIVIGHSDTLGRLLLALAVICFAARAVGGALRRFLNQPPVIGEIAAGLMLGPSVLGALLPEVYEFLLPAGVAPSLAILAKIGVVLFMFLVGLELDLKLLRGNTHATVAISHTSIVVPFLLGSGLALYLYPRYGTSTADFTVFALFIGGSLSITAFPVLARILSDRDAMQTPLGVTALACAAIDDVTAWSMLALVVGLASSQLGAAAWTLALVVGYVVLMFVVVRPVLRWLIDREERLDGPPRRTALAVTFVLLLLSAYATEALGIHALFGAFLFGALLPHDARLSEQLRSSLGDIVVVLLLPAFFAFTGMRTEIGLVDGIGDVLVVLLIIAVATLGKFGGGTIAGRIVGLPWRDASALGILMNTRGLMELIVLNLGLDLGILSKELFTMMVLMALVTTFMAVPILDRILGPNGFRRDEPAPALPITQT